MRSLKNRLFKAENNIGRQGKKKLKILWKCSGNSHESTLCPQDIILLTNCLP